MSSKIEQIIDEIEEYIDNCKPHNFSSSKIVVNRDEIDELLTELRMKTPEEIKRYHRYRQWHSYGYYLHHLWHCLRCPVPALLRS